jgi:hypothetical protein
MEVELLEIGILLGVLDGILLAMSLYVRETGAAWPSSRTAP